MKFLKNLFKYLSILFGLYMLFVFGVIFIENFIDYSIPDRIFEFLYISTLLLSLPFKPILEISDLWISGFMESPTLIGILISLVVYEIILIGFYIFFKKMSLKK